MLRFSTVAGQDGSWSLTARESTHRAVYGSCGRRLVGSCSRRLVALGRQRLEGHVGVVLLVVRAIILLGLLLSLIMFWVSGLYCSLHCTYMHCRGQSLRQSDPDM